MGNCKLTLTRVKFNGNHSHETQKQLLSITKLKYVHATPILHLHPHTCIISP